MTSFVNPSLATEQYCYLTTTGRRSGALHTIEIWFALEGDTLYILAGAGMKSDSVRNAIRDPNARVRIGSTTFEARARVLIPDKPEDALARRLLLEKYAPGYSGSLSDWGRTSLPVAFEVTGVFSTDMASALWPRGRRHG